MNYLIILLVAAFALFVIVKIIQNLTKKDNSNYTGGSPSNNGDFPEKPKDYQP
jgi:large-conductance mechanosensitive channel